MDLHASQIQGFFSIPLDHLVGLPILVQYYLERGFEDEDIVVGTPDIGSVNRARGFAYRLNAPIAIIDKRRPRANVAEVMNVIGDVKGKKVLLVDDLIDTAGTLVEGANALLANGAKEIYACATHGVLSGPAIERIQDSPIKEFLITDTIPLPPEKHIDKIKILSVAPHLCRGH